MTLVNHEPGPSTAQSASSTASTASGQAAGSAGSSRTATTRPDVVATATWPRTSCAEPASSGSSPTTSATISKGDVQWQHATRGPEQLAHAVECRDRIAEQLGETGDDQVADRVTPEAAVAGEP